MMLGTELAVMFLILQKKYMLLIFRAEQVMHGTDPPKEKMHVIGACVHHHIVYVLALDFLKHCSV
jgi:hypothetical protein